MVVFVCNLDIYDKNLLVLLTNGQLIEIAL